MIDSALLAEIVAGVDQGYVVLDPSGHVTTLGNRAATLLGILDVEAAKGQPAASVISIIGADAIILSDEGSALARCLAGGEEWRGPVSGVMVETPTGTRALDIQMRRRNDGGVVILLSDAARLREVLDAHDALVSVTSHELKTPITAIKAMSELMVTYDLGENERKEMLLDIYRQAERLELLIREILDASHIDSGRVPLDLGEVRLLPLIDEVLSELESQVEGRDIVVNVLESLPAVTADEGKLRQVLVNLITNAIKYSPDGKPVIIDATPGSGMVRVTIRDHGIGIKESDMGRLFKKFQRIADPSTRKVPGTGLGLYIVKGLVELQGGRMDVSSEYGKGSTFGFALPVAPGEVA
ncbi:MAG: hypothetical protein NVSMB17_08350 [Candidatus Dormibacteria bacterium]